MANKFQTKLDVEPTVYYDNLFVNEELSEEDVNLSSTVYKINIFGNTHYIAMGKPNAHPENSNVIFFNAYLIYNNKVISKIGVYEMLSTSLNQNGSFPDSNSINFEEHDLLLHPKHMKPPFYLEAFKLTDEELEQEPNKGSVINEDDETKEDIEKANNLERTIVLEGNILNVIPESKRDGLYNAIKAKSTRSDGKSIISTNTQKYMIQQAFSPFIKDMVLPNIQDDEEKQDILNQLSLYNGEKGVLGKKKTKVKGSDGTEKDVFKIGFQLNVKLSSFKKMKIVKMSGKDKRVSMFDYELTPVMMFMLELLLNVKFIILNDGNEFHSLCLFNSYKHSSETDPYRQLTKQIEIMNVQDKLSDSEEKLKKGFQHLHKRLFEYNPTDIIFVKLHDSGKGYVLAKRNEEMSETDASGIETIRDLDKSFWKIFNQHVTSNKHHYQIDNQMKSFKSTMK
jgi:hypothetical protein